MWCQVLRSLNFCFAVARHNTTMSSRRSRRSRPSTEARARFEQERRQAERAGLKSRSTIKLATRNPVLSRYNGITRTSSTPTIKSNTHHNPRKIHRKVNARHTLHSLPAPGTPAFLTSLPNPISSSSVQAQKLSVLAAKQAAKEERQAAKAAAQAYRYAKRVVDTDDECSSGTDWDSDDGGDGDVDLSRPYTGTNRELSEEKKYYGNSGKSYLKDSYASVSRKRLVRRNMHTTDELHDRPCTATRQFVDNCHRLHIPPEPLILRGFHGGARAEKKKKDDIEKKRKALEDEQAREEEQNRNNGLVEENELSTWIAGELTKTDEERKKSAASSSLKAKLDIFLTAYTKVIQNTTDALHALFLEYDTDETGSINLQELQLLLHRIPEQAGIELPSPFTDKECETCLDLFDPDHVELSLEEYLALQEVQEASNKDKEKVAELREHNDHSFHHHTLSLASQRDKSLLSLKHYGIGDVRAGAISESLRILPNLKHLDLENCRLGDAAASHAVDMVVAGLKVQQRLPRVSGGRLNQIEPLLLNNSNNSNNNLNEGLLSLNLSHNKLNIKTSIALGKALRILPCLMVLKLSDCKLGDRVCSKILKPFCRNQSCTVLNLSRNSLSGPASKALAKLLTYNRVLTDLDLSWNKMGKGKDGINLMKSFRGSQLRRIDLSMNVFGGRENGTAVAMLGKVLPETQIKEINLSCNQIAALPCCILMNGVSLHPPLTRLEINQNPVGKQGAASVLRALDLVSKDQHAGGDRLLDIDMYGCACDNMPEESDSQLSCFDFLEPAGSYDLNLDNPEDYALACEILRMLNTRNGYSVRSASWKKPGSKSYSKLVLRRQDRKADACAGPASPFINKKTGKLFIVPDGGNLTYEIIVRPHVTKQWNVISPVGFRQVYDLIDEQQSYLNRITLLDAACETFYFTGEQVRIMSKLFSGHELKIVMPKLMMRVLSTDDADELLNENRHLLTGQLALYQPHCCTGRYVLNMSNSNDRHLVILLMRNSNDDREIAKRDKQNYFDLSQLGDQSNFRNVSWEGEPFLLTGVFDKVHTLPRKGWMVFDYVARCVLPTGLEPGPGIEDEDLKTEETFRLYLHKHTISCTQLLSVIQLLPKPKDWMTLDGKISALFRLLDEDNGGEVDKKEVMSAIIDRPEVGDFMCQIPELEPLLEPRTFGPAFDAIDQDGGGSLDIDEFRQMCGVANDLAAVAQEMFDADSDGEWDAEEDELLRQRMKNVVKDKLNSVHKKLRQQMKDGTPAERFDAVYQLFHEMDIGHKDYLMPEEFANLTSSLGIILSVIELKDAVETIDEDGNGQIEVDEYLDWWGDADLIELYSARVDALESGKPYRMMSDKVSGSSPAERLSIVRQMFGECDIGSKDYLDPTEFHKLSESLGLRLIQSELEGIIEEIDEDGNGQIEVDEYLAWWGDEELVELYETQMEALESKKPYKLFAGKISKKANTRRKRLDSVQELFDANDGGKKEYLTPQEFDTLSKLLGVFLSPKELDAAVAEIDEDGNGQIEVDEYLTWWGDAELLELYEADEAGITLKEVEEEEANAEEVESSDEEDDDDDESGSDTNKKKTGDDEEDEDEKGYRSAYVDHQVLQHIGFQRVDYIVAAHQRLTDLHNFAYFWEFLSKGEVLAVLHRLGWLNVFDPVSPDRRHYMDLEQREMQIVAKVLVRLAVVEPGENWIYENYMDKPGWELPVTWINQVPNVGRLTLTYSSTAKGCAPVWEERIKLRNCCLIPTGK